MISDKVYVDLTILKKKIIDMDLKYSQTNELLEAVSKTENDIDEFVKKLEVSKNGKKD